MALATNEIKITVGVNVVIMIAIHLLFKPDAKSLTLMTLMFYNIQ